MFIAPFSQILLVSVSEMLSVVGDDVVVVVAWVVSFLVVVLSGG